MSTTEDGHETRPSRIAEEAEAETETDRQQPNGLVGKVKVR